MDAFASASSLPRPSLVPAALFGPASLAAAYPSSTVDHQRPRLRARHRHGPVGLARLRHRAGQRPRATSRTSRSSPTTTATRRSRTNDATAMHGGNVIVAMTEANGGDTIVTAPSGQRDATRAAQRRPCSSSRRRATRIRSTPRPGCAGPWMPVASGGPDHPDRVTGDRRRPPRPVHAGGTTQLHGTVRRSYQLERSGPDGQHGADRAVRGRRGAGRVAVELGRCSAGRVPRGWHWGFQQSEAQSVAARSYVESTPGLRRLRRHLRPDLPVLPGHGGRDRSHRSGRVRHRRPGHGRSTAPARSPPPSTRPPRAATRPAPSSLPCPTTATPCACPAPATPTTTGASPSRFRPFRPPTRRSARWLPSRSRRATV